MRDHAVKSIRSSIYNGSQVNKRRKFTHASYESLKWRDRHSGLESIYFM